MKRGHSGWPARRCLCCLRLLSWICCGLPCQMSCHCLIFIWIFFNDFILIYLNSRVIHAYQCTNPVDLPWRTGAGPASVRCWFRPSWGVLRHAHWVMETNDWPAPLAGLLRCIFFGQPGSVSKFPPFLWVKLWVGWVGRGYIEISRYFPALWINRVTLVTKIKLWYSLRY